MVSAGHVRAVLEGGGGEHVSSYERPGRHSSNGHLVVDGHCLHPVLALAVGLSDDGLVPLGEELGLLLMHVVLTTT